jgi:hypothetical protein
MVVWQLMHDVFGDFELGMECVVLRKILDVLWELQRFLGSRESWEVMVIVLADSALNFCPSFETEPC